MKLLSASFSKIILPLTLSAYAVAANAQQIVLPALPDVYPHKTATSFMTEKAAAGVPRLLRKSVYVANKTVLVPKDSSVMSYRNAASSQVDSLTIHKYNAGRWYRDSRYLYTFNSADSIIRTDLQVWNSSKGIFANLGRYNYTYDASNHKTGMLYEVWDILTGSFINGIQETYTVTGGSTTDMIQQMWVKSTSSWVNNQHITYSYNNQGSVTDYILQVWNGSTNNWLNKTRIMNSYDASGKQVTLSETFSWNATAAAWENAKRVSNTLNTSGKVHIATTDYFNNMSGLWEPNLKETYSYNATGNYASLLAEVWNAAAKSYGNSTTTSYTYNSYDLPTIVNTRTWVSGAWTTGDESGRIRYYYEGEKEPEGEDSTLSTSISNSLHGIAISPNPASDMLHVTAKQGVAKDLTVAVSDMQGRVCITLAIKGASSVSEHISVATLPAGCYVVSLIGEGFRQQQLVSIVH